MTDQDCCLSEHDLEAITEQVLDEIGLSLAELREEGQRGRFSSESAHHGWHVLRGLGRL